MIEFSHVYKSYAGNFHALRNVDLDIAKGEFTFLTGPSGAGKTTLFKMLSAFDFPTSGKIKVAGQDLRDLNSSNISGYRRKIGIVFQDFKLLRDRTIFENVALPLIIRNEDKNIIQNKVFNLLREVGLDDKWDCYPEFISGGEQQRAAIARAMIHQPDVLIADEPTGNLDPKLSEDIMDLFEKACARGATVFIASHDKEMVKLRKKRVVHLVNGEISDGSL